MKLCQPQMDGMQGLVSLEPAWSWRRLDTEPLDRVSGELSLANHYTVVPMSALRKVQIYKTPRKYKLRKTVLRNYFR